MESSLTLVVNRASRPPLYHVYQLFLLVAVTNYLTRGSVSQEGFIVTQSLSPVMAGKAWEQELEAAGHTASAGRNQGE